MWCSAASLAPACCPSPQAQTAHSRSPTQPVPGSRPPDLAHRSTGPGLTPPPCGTGTKSVHPLEAPQSISFGSVCSSSTPRTRARSRRRRAISTRKATTPREGSCLTTSTIFGGGGREPSESSPASSAARLFLHFLELHPHTRQLHALETVGEPRDEQERNQGQSHSINCGKATEMENQ